jgi:hypothetical protein
MKVLINIHYSSAIEKIIAELKDCNTIAEKVNYNTISIEVDETMSAQDLILMGMMIKTCEKP